MSFCEAPPRSHMRFVGDAQVGKGRRPYPRPSFRVELPTGMASPHRICANENSTQRKRPLIPRTRQPVLPRVTATLFSSLPLAVSSRRWRALCRPCCNTHHAPRFPLPTAGGGPCAAGRAVRLLHQRAARAARGPQR